MSAGSYTGDVAGLIMVTFAAVVLAFGATIVLDLLLGPPTPLAVLP